MAEVTITDLEYADDTASMDTDWERFQGEAEILDDVVREWGGEVSLKKTEWLRVHGVKPQALPPPPPPPPPPVAVAVALEGGDPPPAESAAQPPRRELWLRSTSLKETELFCYFGSLVGSAASLGVSEDVTSRVQKGVSVFGTLNQLFRSRRISRRTTGRVLLTAVSNVVFYGAESWALHKVDRDRLRRFWNGCVRSAAGIPYERRVEERVTMSHLLDLLGVPSAMTLVMRRFVRWLGHAAGMGPERLPRQALFGKIPDRTGVWLNRRDVPFRMPTYQARQ